MKLFYLFLCATLGACSNFAGNGAQTSALDASAVTSTDFIDAMQSGAHGIVRFNPKSNFTQLYHEMEASASDHPIAIDGFQLAGAQGYLKQVQSHFTELNESYKDLGMVLPQAHRIEAAQLRTSLTELSKQMTDRGLGKVIRDGAPSDRLTSLNNLKVLLGAAFIEQIYQTSHQGRSSTVALALDRIGDKSKSIPYVEEGDGKACVSCGGLGCLLFCCFFWCADIAL